jgi:hypothetical protein
MINKIFDADCEDKDMSESKNTQEANTVQGGATGEGMVIGDKNTVIHHYYHSPSRIYTPTEKQFLQEEIKKIFQYHKDEHEQESLFIEIIINLMTKYDMDSILQAMEEVRNAKIHGKSNKAINEEWNELAKEMKNTPIIPLRINEEPLTPQTLVITFTALTELATKLWLIGKHRFADLIEYTQTRDVRFANEAGATIVRVAYNSPFNFGVQVDKLVPGVADAVMTIVDGLSQRKAKREQVEIDNRAAAQRIKEAAEALKQQQKYSELEREKMELGLERLSLENEKKRQALVEQRLESRIKQIDVALELAGKAVDIVYPNVDADMRPILIQTLVNSILQLDTVKGLELTLLMPKGDENKPKEDTGQ